MWPAKARLKPVLQTLHLQRDEFRKDHIPAYQKASSRVLAGKVGAQRILLLPSCDATVCKRHGCFLG